MTFDSGDPSRHQSWQQQHLLTKLSPRLVIPKFQMAYSDIEDKRKRILTFDNDKIGFSISLSTADRLCIVGSERKYSNAILMRLCVRSLISKDKVDLNLHM